MLYEALEATVRKSGASGAGTGPFATVPTNTTELQPNEGYYLGRPQVSRIVLSNYPTVRAAWADLLRDRLDMLYEVGIDALDSMQRSSSVSVFTVSRPYQHVVLLNTQSPVLRSAELRRALNLAVDQTALVKEALNTYGVPSRGPVSPRYWALPADAPTFEHNPSEAARLMAGRGPEGGKGPRLQFTCLVPPDAVNERVALALKRQLQQLGVDMVLEQASLERILEVTARRDYEAALLEGVSGPTLLRAYYFWHSNTPFNSGGWGSPVIDAALDRARNVSSEKDYIEAVGALQRVFVEDPPAIFLAWSVRARAVSKRFVVPEVDPDRDVLSTLRLWKPAMPELRTSRN
jgi:peptide/nickel transport system substrate-binding protein